MAFFGTGFTLRLSLTGRLWATLDPVEALRFCALCPRAGPWTRLTVVFGDMDAGALDKSSSTIVPYAGFNIGPLLLEFADFLNVLAFALLILAVGWSSTGLTASTNSMYDSFASQSRSIRLMMASTKLSLGMNEPRSRNSFKLFRSMQLMPDLSTSSYNLLRLYLGVLASSCFSISYLRANRSS